MVASYKDTGRRLARALTANCAARWILSKASHAGILPGWIWKRLPVQTAFRVPLSDGIGFQYSSVANDELGRALYWRGLTSWEPETVRVFRQLVGKARLVLDVGANTGVYALLACAANPVVQVFAFEPVPHIYQRLCENVRLNRWQSRVRTENKAVSNFVGLAKFHVPYGDVPTSASLCVEGFRGVEGELIEVQVTTIDAACPGYERIDLVKIDVEGFEDKVLEGMQRVLTESQPAVIVECNPDGPYRSVQDILTQFGYHFFHLRERGPIAMAEIIPDITECYRNYLCIPGRCFEWLGQQ